MSELALCGVGHARVRGHGADLAWGAENDASEWQRVVSVTDRVLQLLGLTSPSQPISLPGRLPVAVRPGEHGELAEAMRRLPGRFRDRLSTSAFKRVTGLAASGQWERAADQLVMALYVSDAPVSEGERDELRDALEALGLPTHRLDRLPSY